MSHFTCLAVLPNNQTYSDQELEKLFAPYAEHLEVEPYKVSCGCIGWEARRAGIMKAEQELGKSIQDYRDEYHKMDQEKQPEWEDFIAPYVSLKEAYEQEHPLFEQPNPECEECNGTGVDLSTYNPKSKWDWYTVGGRWKNMILTKSGDWVDYAKVKDIDFEKMKELNEKEARKTWKEAEGKNEGDRYWHYGIEKHMSKEEYLDSRTNFSTFSVLSEDGLWHERGKMSLFAVVTDETESEAEWTKQFYARFIEKLSPETTLVVVDCHI